MSFEMESAGRVKTNGGHSVTFFNVFQNEICRQSNQIVQHSVIGKTYAEGSFPLRLSETILGIGGTG